MAVFDNLKEIVNITANRALISDANGRVAASSTITTTELGYLNGVTSNIQTQLNDKLNKGGHAVNKAVVTDGNGNIAPTGITSAEIGALSGVTSNIQTQLNGKATLGGQPNFQGIHVGEAGAVGYIYPGGTDGNIWFRYQNASGGTHYANMRTIVRGSVSGTTLILEIG